MKIAVLETQVERLLEKQKELTERVRANEKVVAAIGLLGSIAIAVIGAGYFAPKAEACSPRLDGEPTYCPPWDEVLVREPEGITEESFDEEFPDAFTHTVTLYDTRVSHMGHDSPKWPTAGEWIQKVRDHEARKTRTPAEESINRSLDLWEEEDGSNDPTKQEKLLQLQSDKDRQSFRW